MQNERTLQFWDDYYKEHDAKEWILQPSNELLELIASQCPKSRSDLNILEIGCGTSTMARELWQHIQHDESRNVYMCATDVSPVCIQINEERDEALLKNENSEPGKSSSALEYRVLNVVEDRPNASVACWDIILDKACLDTFLFRSRQRGQRRGYTTLVQTALDNIWSWMADDGVYLIISPRPRLKAVRDYAGFCSVEKHALSSAPKGDRINDKTDNPGYIYVCRKNKAYAPGKTPAFAAYYTGLPQDDAKCRHCGITFVELREGEAVEGQGDDFWTREWKDHCLHCKVPHKPLWA
jgi:SAM-dependent methyltransferase